METTKGNSKEMNKPQMAPNIEIRTILIASWLTAVSEAAALITINNEEQRVLGTDLSPEERRPDVLTDEAAEETEDGDGDGECPVPVDDHRHGPGVRQVVTDQEHQHKQHPDEGEDAGQPDKRLEITEIRQIMTRVTSLPDRRIWLTGFRDLLKHRN